MKSSEQQRSSKLRSLYGSDASSLCAETCFGEQTAFSFFGTDMWLYFDSETGLNAQWPWSSENPAAQVDRFMVLKIKQHSPQGVET